MDTLFHNTCLNKKQKKRPIWMMRQAGRYLEEYRNIRKLYPQFMDFCFSPKAVQEVTLQPIDRFDFDAAIIFSDILTIPHAMGQTVTFETGEGPRLISFCDSFLKNMSWSILDPVYEGIQLTRSALGQDKSLIGFSGTPWTLAAYMIHREKIGDGAVLIQSLKNFPLIDSLIDVLVDRIILHLVNQIKAGCDVVQIFDSWAGLCPKEHTEKYIKGPIEKILNGVWAQFPKTPIIYFARHRGDVYSTLNIDHHTPLVLGIDQETDIGQMTRLGFPIQGNLDPDVLIEGGEKLTKSVCEILEKTKDFAHIFNLGHGIKPHTPIAHVQEMISLVRHG